MHLLSLDLWQFDVINVFTHTKGLERSCKKWASFAEKGTFRFESSAVIKLRQFFGKYLRATSQMHLQREGHDVNKRDK